MLVIFTIYVSVSPFSAFVVTLTTVVSSGLRLLMVKLDLSLGFVNEPLPESFLISSTLAFGSFILIGHVYSVLSVVISITFTVSVEPIPGVTPLIVASSFFSLTIVYSYIIEVLPSSETDLTETIVSVVVDNLSTENEGVDSFNLFVNITPSGLVLIFRPSVP